MEHYERKEDEAAQIAERLSRELGDHGLSVSVAESLTGGKLANQLAAAPNSSEWFAGAIVCYWSKIKHSVLNVPDGPVISEEAATAMARNVSDMMGTDTSIAASGVGGPGRQEGHEPGTTWIAVCVNGDVHAELHHFEGDPIEILAQTEKQGLLLLERELRKLHG